MLVAEREIGEQATAAPVDSSPGYSLKENATLSLVSAFMTFAAGTLVTLLQGHFLPLAVFGRVAYAATFSGLVALIPNYGFELLVVREIAQNRCSPAQTMINVLTAKTLLLLPAVVLTQIFMSLNHTPADEAALIWVYLGGYFVLALSRVFCSVSKGRDNFRVETAVYSLQAAVILASTLFVILVLKWTAAIPQAWMALLGRLSGFLLATILTARLWNRKVRFVPDWGVIKDLLRAGFPFGLQAALVTAYVQVDILFIRNLLGLDETAYYQAALRIILGLNMLASFLSSAFYPRVAHSFKNGIAAGRLDHSRKMLCTLTLVGAFISMGLFLGAGPLLHIVYGPKMGPSVSILRVAAFIPVIRFIAGGYGVILMSIHRQDIQVIGAAVATVLIAALDWLLVPWVGYMGAVWINLLVNGVVLAIFLYFVFKELHSTLMVTNVSDFYSETLAVWNSGARAARRIFYVARQGGTDQQHRTTSAENNTISP